MSKTNEPAAQRAPGNREGFVPRAGIIAFTCGLLLLAAVTLYSLWAFWPLGLEIVAENPERRKVSYLGLTNFTVSTEGIYFVTVALAGALGGVVHTLRSFSMYVGTRQLRWSWVPFNLLLPVVGALGGTLFYLVFRAGLFSSSTSTSDASPFGFAAIAALVGLFSEQAVEKLRQIARQVFTEAPRYQPDHYDAATRPENPRTRQAMPPPMRSSPEPASRSVPVRVRWVLACCLGLAVAALAGEARPDLGAFPGANGLIAFQSFRGGSSQIYLETVPPTPVRRLTDPRHCYALPAWSPNGRWIAFEYNPSPIGLHSGASDIWVMNPATRQPWATARPLTKVPGFDGDPSWSPNGKQIVFESTRSGNPDVWVMNADGTSPRDLTPNTPEFDGDPAWSPGGGRIAFTSRRDGNKEIYLMNPDGTGLLNITNNRADDFDPTWSPDGQLVGFVSTRDRSYEIYETNDRFLLKRLTHDPGLDAFPAWSPDGRWIAFTTDRGDAGNRDLHYMSNNGDDSGVTELTQAPGWDQAPDWQRKPVGTSLALPPTRASANLPHKASPSDPQQAVACIGNAR